MVKRKKIVLVGAIALIAMAIVVVTKIVIQDSFTIVVLPDTQNYVRLHPNTLCKQTEWIVANKDNLRILFASQLGDLVQNGGYEMDEWQSISKCMGLLDGVIPYAVIPGNHDVDRVDEGTSSATIFNEFFPIARFSRYQWYGGSYKGNQNNFQTISRNGIQLLIVNLEVDPTDDDLSWAQGIVQKNRDKRVILTTHAYQYDDRSSRSSSPHFRTNGNSGEDVWQKLVRDNCNIFLVLSGHFHHEDGENRLVSKNACGNDVNQLVQDYQSRENGGNGLLRILRFTPLLHRIFVQTYSPVSQQYELDTNSMFQIPLPLH